MKKFVADLAGIPIKPFVTVRFEKKKKKREEKNTREGTQAPQGRVLAILILGGTVPRRSSRDCV